MDFIFELLTEIIIEGTIGGATSKEVPKPIRILLLLVVLGIYMFLTGCLIVLIVRYPDVRWICIGLVILFVWFIIHICRKFYRKWKE